MAHPRGVWWSRVAWVLVASAWPGVLCTSEARADRIVLRNGQQVRGKVTPDANRPDRVVVLTERGKTPLSFPKAQVVDVIAEPSALDEYVAKREGTSETAESQYELGLWCERQRLPDLAWVHYEAAVRHDKGFEPARRKLGYVLYEGRWLKGDELREAQGLVRYKGKWITPEDKARHDQEAATAAEQAVWARRIKLLRESIVFSGEDRQREAEAQLLEIRDPAAIPPLVRVLGGDTVKMRVLLSHVVGAIPGPEASTALVSLLLGEGEPEVRFATLDELSRRKESEVNRLLVRGLRSAAPEVINRAAWGLGHLNAVSAVPSLVGALVTTQYQTVMAPSPGGMAEGSAISATFGSVPPSPSFGGGGTPIAYNGSSVGYLTGAAVGPGVAAYGASSVSSYSVPTYSVLPGDGPSPAGLGINAGGGVNASRGPVARVVKVPVRNVEVLAALVRLTGQDFGYDIAAWKHWVQTSYQSEPSPARRVPQP